MNQDTSPGMPMASATRLPLSPADMLPPPRVAKPPVTPPTAAGQLGVPPMGAPAPVGPPAGVEVKMQPDGSSIYVHAGTGTVLGVNKPVKLPPALQAPTQPLGQPQLPIL